MASSAPLSPRLFSPPKVAARLHARRAKSAGAARYTERFSLLRMTPAMLNQPRLDEILRLINLQQRVKAADLAKAMQVSEETIRRDLKHLEEVGKLRRIHGGAVLPKPNEEQPLQVRSRIQMRAKTRLAACAAELVQEGMALFLDTGTTTLALAQQLTRFKALRVVTNSLDIGLLLTQHSANQVLMAPGDIRRNDNALIGPHTLAFAAGFHYDIAFMGIGAVDAELGLMDYEEPEAHLRRTLTASCRRSVILADDAKFGHRTFINTLPFSAVDTLVSNRPPSAEFVRCLESADVELVHP